MTRVPDIKVAHVHYISTPWDEAVAEFFLRAAQAPDGAARLEAWVKSGGASAAQAFSEPEIIDGFLVITHLPSPSMLALLDDLRRAARGVAA